MSVYLDPFQEFALEIRSLHSRKVALSELVKLRRGYEWVAILTDGYLYYDGADKNIKNFTDLIAEIRVEDVRMAIDIARRTGHFTEGKKILPNSTVISLQRSGVEPFWIRSAETSSKQVITARQMMDGIDGVGREKLGEFDMCDSGAIWYARFRDDDPLIFMFAEKSLIKEIAFDSPESVLEVPGDFIYAY